MYSSYDQMNIALLHLLASLVVGIDPSISLEKIKTPAFLDNGDLNPIPFSQFELILKDVDTRDFPPTEMWPFDGSNIMDFHCTEELTSCLGISMTTFEVMCGIAAVTTFGTACAACLTSLGFGAAGCIYQFCTRY
jgi:hypothetical protein